MAPKKKATAKKASTSGKATNAEQGSPSTSPVPKRQRGGSKGKETKEPQAPEMDPELLAGLRPEAARWFRASVERWGLLPPYDPQAAWEPYYKERAALDWWAAASRRKGDDNDEEWEARPPLPWPEDFPQPDTAEALEPFPSEYVIDELSYAGWDGCGTVEGMNAALRGAVERVAAGCPRVEAATPGLAAALGKGAYFLTFDAEPSGDDQPRTVDYTTRLYSPCGQSKSIDFTYSYHHRTRLTSIELYSTCAYSLRRGADCQPDQPLEFKEEGKKTLFHLKLENCGCEKIRLKMNGPKLKAIQKELLGRSDLLSALAMMNLLISAATQMGQSMASDGAAPVLKKARHRLEPRPGEAPEATGYESDDSYGCPATSRGCSHWDNNSCTAGSDDGWSTEPRTDDDEDEDGSGSDDGDLGGGAGYLLATLMAQQMRKRRLRIPDLRRT